MSAEAIAKALGGRKVGITWMAKCPVHADRCSAGRKWCR
jgi:putative DNA primase/helicase